MRLYYYIKPYLPWRLRIALRRKLARRQRRLCLDTWPINPTASTPPADWTGWPDGKQFSLVLTHDVEGPSGLAKCPKLMKLEKSLGFHSSFNLVPEGSYSVPAELRDELAQNGFEVGVHDLYHDGKLYWSQRVFMRNARHINRHLRDWGASGFRAGFMLHNLDYLHALDIEYDASTFDSDPFEPQPDGVHTIFPFWVDGLMGRGYVELPYTLPQDSTLFLLLQESSPDIWKTKLDWIVTHGGMALLNVHPDYLQFDGEKPRPHTYPAELYRQFLEYVRQRYANKFWNPLPREVATWYRSYAGKNLVAEEFFIPTSRMTLPRPLDGRSAAVVVYSNYPGDARPRREAEALLTEGMSVDYICLEDDRSGAGEEVHGRLRVTRLPIKHERKGRTGYLNRYGRFVLHSFLLLAVRSLSRRYDIVHIHNMPDALVFTALVPRLRGARVILDLHDPMPEPYQTIYHMSPDMLAVKVLKLIEKWSIGFADLALTPNKAFRDVFCSRSCPHSKMQIVMNTPDEAIFRRKGSGAETRFATPQRGEFRIMYHGLIAERQGLGIAVQAMKFLADRAPDSILYIYGPRTAYLDVVERTIKDLGLENMIRYKGKRRLEEIPEEILQADLGIVPNPRTPFTEINFPTRIFEYLAMSRPAIAPRTRGIRDYFGDDEILYFQPDNPEDLARVILQARNHPEQTNNVLQRGVAVYHRHRWSAERTRFVNLVTKLLSEQVESES